ncbi:hypothetical protein N8I77_010403 [Diaporthe amygdali]|uniref:Ecp2 effector protein-like domain-containing protein n=1 Tax=Phomopsis amygdali TaxID=1214568 RepID=A0AAD9S888_PHOAM|nr:hypothetical protein N8I77_010403 [Diaporthe amygdali]
MKLTNILLPFLIAMVAAAQQNHSSPPDIGMNTTNSTAEDQGKDLATMNRWVEWFPLDDDQETCADAQAKEVGDMVIFKADCQRVVDYMNSRSGYWTVSGYGGGDVYAPLVNRGTCSFGVARVDGQNLYFEFGNLDVVYFVQQAIRTSANANHMATVIGSVQCDGENSPLVEWKVGLPPSGGVLSARTSAVGWIMVGLSAIFLSH